MHETCKHSKRATASARAVRSHLAARSRRRVTRLTKDNVTGSDVCSKLTTFVVAEDEQREEAAALPRATLEGRCGDRERDDRRPAARAG